MSLAGVILLKATRCLTRVITTCIINLTPDVFLSLMKLTEFVFVMDCGNVKIFIEERKTQQEKAALTLLPFGPATPGMPL